MNTPKPNHTKRRRTRRLGSPVAPLYDDLRGANVPPVLVGWVNRRSGDVFTPTMGISEPMRPVVSKGEDGKGQSSSRPSVSHTTRERAVQALGFESSNPIQRVNRASMRGQRRMIKGLVARFQPKTIIHEGRTTRSEPFVVPPVPEETTDDPELLTD